MSDKNIKEAQVREKLEAFRAKLYGRFGNKGTKLFFYGVPSFILALVLIIVALFLIPIKSIEISGDVTVFNEGEIIYAAEINEGDSLFLKSANKIEKNINENLPLASTVKVNKNLFGKVKIYVEFDSVCYYIAYGDRYYAIDESLNVLDSDLSWSKYSSAGGVRVVLPEIRKPEVNKKIVFYDTVEETDTEGETVYEIKEEKVYNYVSEFLTELKKNGYLTEANGVLLDKKFDVKLIYANKFSINFGDCKDLDVKFRVLYEILAEGSTKYSDKVSIDVSNPSEATARSDSTLDFSQFAD